MKQLLTGILLVMFIVNVKSQTLDQDYITGIPTTTSFGGQPLGADNDQGQSFTAGVTGGLWSVEVVADVSDPFLSCNCLEVGLIMEITNGDGFGGTVLGISDLVVPSIGQGILIFNFSGSIPLLSGNSYTWEVKRVTESCSALSVSLEAEFNGSYTGGAAYNNGVIAGTQDILFRTFMGNYLPPNPPAPDPAFCNLDQDYISGIPTTTSFGGHTLGADNDQGQSFTSSISGNLQAIEVVLNIESFDPCNVIGDSVTLIIELHEGNGFLGSILGTTSSKKFEAIADSTVAFFFPTPVPVALGATYTFELKRIAESINNNLSVSLEAEFNGSYAGGAAYNNGVIAGTQDILFRNYNCCVVGNGTDIITACNSYTWIDGETYTASNNTATFNIVGGAANGCDSLVALDLTIINSSAGVDTRTECNSYTWIDGNTYTSSNNTATFNIVGGAANGCDSLVALDLTIINSSTGTDTRTECNSYTWIDGNSYTTSNNTATFNILGGAANGCDSLVTLDLTINTVSNLTTTISGPTIIASNGNATYQWLDCDNNNSVIPGETNQGFTPAENGNYAVELTENGCLDTTACVVITTAGIIENSFGSNLIVYPNPTSGNFSIDLGAFHESTIVSITDITGKLITSKAITQSQILYLEIKEPAGVYIISIQSGDRKAIFRLVKE